MTSRWSRVKKVVATATMFLATPALGDDAPQKYVFRNTDNLASQGYLIRNILSTEPLFEDAIHVSETQQTVVALRRLPIWRAAPTAPTGTVR